MHIQKINTIKNTSLTLALTPILIFSTLIPSTVTAGTEMVQNGASCVVSHMGEKRTHPHHYYNGRIINVGKRNLSINCSLPNDEFRGKKFLWTTVHLKSTFGNYGGGPTCKLQSFYYNGKLKKQISKRVGANTGLRTLRFGKIDIAENGSVNLRCLLPPKSELMTIRYRPQKK